LHELSTNKSHKLLIMGGLEYRGATNRVEMMVIDDEGTKISWQTCAPMIRKRWSHSVNYCQGQVLSVNSYDAMLADGQDSNERYDVLSQTAVELEHKLPVQNQYGAAIAELDGKTLAIGGANVNQFVKSDSVFRFDNKRHQGQAAGTWIEQESRLINARMHAAVATYKGKIWLAGGFNSDYWSRYFLSSVEVFDPLVGSWQEAGDLTKPRGGIGGIALFAIKDDLFAAGGTYEGMWVEKRDGKTGAWHLVSELNGEDRALSSLAACGSTIFFLGGNDLSTNKSWNSFDTRTNAWASQQEQYRDEATRKLPRDLCAGRVVCITPSEQLSGLTTWTRV